VSLVAHVTGLGDTLKQCSVSWGDGPTQSVSCSAGSASHAYSAAGTYRVTYAVTDAYGQQTAAPSQLVTVSAAS
jgi:PKD repeat protein